MERCKMICPYCGKQLYDSAKFCSSCGRNLTQPRYYQPPVQQTIITDSSSPGAFILGLILPVIISLIIYFSWHNNTPMKAKSLMTGLLIRVVPTVISVVLFFAWLMSP